jgi:hypothetical protein
MPLIALIKDEDSAVWFYCGAAPWTHLQHLQSKVKTELSLIELGDGTYNGATLWRRNFEHLKIRNSWYQFDPAMLDFEDLDKTDEDPLPRKYRGG